MKYSISIGIIHRAKGRYEVTHNYELRDNHVKALYEIYKEYGLNFWRSDFSKTLFKGINEHKYFIKRMQSYFIFIAPVYPPLLNYKSSEKNMAHYIITNAGLKMLAEFGYELKDEDTILVAKNLLEK